MHQHGHQDTRTGGAPTHQPRDRRTPAGPAAVLALQRAAGNATVGRMLAVQRVTQPPLPANQTPPAVPITINEVQEIQNYLANTANQDVRNLLNQLMPHLHRISSFTRAPTSTSGGNTHIDDAATTAAGANRYTINYGAGGTVEQQVAILVHEVTHILINESYDAEMLNYPVQPLPAIGPVAQHEGQRQQERIGLTDPAELQRFSAYATRTIADLITLLPSSGFGPARMREISNKLGIHTMQNTLSEYDGVLAHVLVWSDQDDIPTTSQFYQRLVAAVNETTAWRQAGAITPGIAAPLEAERNRITAARPAVDAAIAAATPPPPPDRRRDRVLAVLRKLVPR
ncbi:hypothetical protein [Actinoplanes sp. NPDC051851]|uniref:hypothetical protein n=1 Tax=Actinoplanes sp. NPDC051851 TaxID=3154753 RepID=UPI00342D64E8